MCGLPTSAMGCERQRLGLSSRVVEAVCPASGEDGSELRAVGRTPAASDRLGRLTAGDPREPTAGHRNR